MKTCKNCYAAETGAHPMSGQAHGCTLGYKTDGQGHALECRCTGHLNCRIGGIN